MTKEQSKIMLQSNVLCLQACLFRASIACPISGNKLILKKVLRSSYF